MVKIKHPTSEESDRLLCYAIYTGRGVAPEVNLREGISRTPLQSLNKAAHSGFETQRSLKQGYQCPQKIFWIRAVLHILQTTFESLEVGLPHN